MIINQENNMQINLNLATDLYQLTMSQSLFNENKHNNKATFDLFFRKHEESPFVVVCGIETAINYVNNFHFSENDINYLRSQNLFSEEFLLYLQNIRFTGNIWAMDEGTISFGHEPIMRISGSLVECQLLETTLLNIINFETLIATKSDRVVRAAEGFPISEFGLRRAQSASAGLLGSRAAYVGGCTSTSNVLAGEEFGIPISGTHAHSYVTSFETELEAFRCYAKSFPKKCILLIDTYDVLNSGLPNAITVFKELRANGHEPIGIRIDSGDLAYLTKQVRRKLNDEGFPNAKIVVSNDLDEYIITDLKRQGAEIDIYGVGTKLITSYDTPALGGVYKLSELNGQPKMKLSENIAKTTNPCKKMVYRLIDNTNGKALADLITVDDETIDGNKPLKIYHPNHTWQTKELINFTAVPLLSKYYDNGICRNIPTIEDARNNLKNNLALFWDEYLRLTNPQEYKVDISNKLYDIKKELINTLRR